MLVSIIMAIYNEEKYISQSINSILKQTFSDFELIIIDDGSTDKTHEMIQPFLSDKRIQYVNKGKVGKVEAFNIGFSKSSGKFICFFHGDDIMIKNSIEIRVNPLIRYENELVASAGKLFTISDIDKYNAITVPKSEKGSLSGQAIMINKNLANIIFPIPNYLPNEDAWMRMHIEYFADKIVHVPEIIAKYRIHDSNSFLSTSTMNNFKEKNKKIHLRRKNVYKAFLDKYESKLSLIDINRIKNILIAEDYRYNGHWMKILFSKIRFRLKISFIFESNNFMYRIKNKYIKFFTGLG